MSRLSDAQIETIRAVAERHGLASVRIFGSMARGNAGPDSDLDILVRFSKPGTLVHVIAFKQALEEALHMKVDVVEEGGVSPYLKDKISAEAISL